MSEEVESTAQAALYPVGALLNYALLLATTEVRTAHPTMHVVRP